LLQSWSARILRGFRRDAEGGAASLSAANGTAVASTGDDPHALAGLGVVRDQREVRRNSTMPDNSPPSS